MFRQSLLKTIVILALLGGGVVYTFFTGYFGKELVIEAATLAILAISLDMVAGYGGMISLCHGAIFGIGAYTFAALTVLFGVHPLLAFAAAIVATALFGAVVGAITSRTHGIFFIMATLAFGQMAYVTIFESRTLGGDDGLAGVPRLDLSAIGIDLMNSTNFALFAIAALALVYVIAAFVLRSGFGRTLVGIHVNEARMKAVGLTVWHYKAAAFGISGALAGLGGAIAAQQTMFVSPELLVWMVSGTVLMVVIFGGIGTLVGPAVGAVVWVFLKHEISSITVHWHMIAGAVLIITIVAGGRGLYGQIEYMIENRRAKQKQPDETNVSPLAQERETHA
ncbi:branched-chain amino acid ABC transporter permease [Amorphus orientalis]|uniref:Branched-chain amino acid transport system permease protein n=1 Tax=Amorphus orientalis TaxID=649198 RepID=A0AAE3VR59_9HYPH|nr:branched-chain amino acid ABC transporter permease [Amorphus orientalis]MDQ0316473.1 branched-chain amino acid transport system permease protein [Amorphus orientalis]